LNTFISDSVLPRESGTPYARGLPNSLEIIAYYHQIAESFRRFGITDTTTTLLAIKVLNVPNSAPATSHPSTHLAGVVQGTRISFTDESLASITDVARVRKIYKLDAPSEGAPKKRLKLPNGLSQESAEANEREEMEKVILGLMAIKGS